MKEPKAGTKAVWNLEAGVDAEAMEGGAGHWFIPSGLLSLVSYRIQDHQPSDGTAHNGLGPSLPTTNGRVPQAFL